LSQYGKDGVQQAVGYFSQKHDAAQANYTNHDKELLAVIKCLAQWDVELKMVRKFTVIADHKNLEYFTIRQLLSERQIRWADTLSMYNLTFVYRPGKVNGRADVMSCKEEDTPAGEDNNQMMSREFRMLCPVTSRNSPSTRGKLEPRSAFWLELPFPAPCASRTGSLACSAGQQAAQQRNWVEPKTRLCRTLTLGYSPEP
jgi:hypothetical protein